jgi:hypothetical protein
MLLLVAKMRTAPPLLVMFVLGAFNSKWAMPTRRDGKTSG